MRKKAMFQRYEESTLPLIVRLNCNDQNWICNQVGKFGEPFLFKRAELWPFPSELQTDRQYLEYLFEQMQPAVKYVEEIKEVVEFIDEHDVVVFLFGNDQNLSMETAADSMRSLAKFGRNRDPDVAAYYQISSEEMPMLVMFRDFGEIIHYEDYLGDIKNVTEWVKANCIMSFGEYNDQTMKRYKGLNLPMFVIILDQQDETFGAIETAVNEEVLPMIHDEGIDGVVTYIDVYSHAKMALEVGDYPRIEISTGEKL